MTSNPSPETGSWLFGSLMFSWLNPLFRIAKKREMTSFDIFELPNKEATRRMTRHFEREWKFNFQKFPTDKRSDKVLANACQDSLYTVVRRPLLFAGFFRIIQSIIQIVIPFAVAEFLNFISITHPFGEEEYKRGAAWPIIFGFLFSLVSVVENYYLWLTLRCGWQCRSVISSAVYNKSLRLSTSSRQALSQGEVVNLMQLDAEKVERVLPYIHVIWDGVFQIVGYCCVIYFYIAESVFVGLLVLLLSIPLLALVYMSIEASLRKLSLFTDERVKLINESLVSMFAIKSAGWENEFLKRIQVLRETELVPLRKTIIPKSLLWTIIVSVPAFTAAAALAVFALNRGTNSVSAAVIFGASQGFAFLRKPLFQIPEALTYYGDAKISLGRISRFLALEESKKVADQVKTQIKKTSSHDTVVKFKDAEFYWSLEKRMDNYLMGVKKDKESMKESKTESPMFPALSSVDLTILQGQLIAVVGPVASGKSTLLTAILGELEQTKGVAQVEGSCAYAAQTAWIQNGSIRDNILFGDDLDEARYSKVLDVCQLRSDLAVLPDSDATMIGERGINLSGGQAQRVSVARVAYNKNDVVILDDPLSALDPEVAIKFFEECILKFMKGRTRIMVTNQLNFLKHCDYVIVLGKQSNSDSGRKTSVIQMQGSYSTLLKEQPNFLDLVKSFEKSQTDDSKDSKEEKTQEGNPTEGHQTSTIVDKDAKGKDLLQEEEKEIGSVKLEYYRKYISAGGVILFSGGIVFLLLGHIVGIYGIFVLGIWAEDAAYIEHPLEYYLALYAGTGVLSGFLFFMENYLLNVMGIRASRILHEKLLDGVLKAPISFFDTTPTGRILARFARDTFSIDTELPMSLITFLFMASLFIVKLVTIATQIVALLAFFPIILGLYVHFMRNYRSVARDVKRLEALSRSPVYSHFGETLSGLSSIRAFNKSKVFRKKCEILVDNSIKITYIFKALERWMAIRLGLLTAFIVTVSTALIIASFFLSSFNAGVAGAILLLLLPLTDVVNNIVQSFISVETIFNSIERVNHYSHNIEEEKPFIIESNRPPLQWPTSGTIIFEDIKMRYREGTPLVLKGISVTIPGSTSCGIVGRTGSGKSSLMKVLLRIMELESGRILIDGIDVSSIGLHDLRQKVSMVPQNPVMYSGTLRLNLDPFSKCTDESLWKVLEHVDLKQQVMELPEKLDTKVVEYGENFSQGQRQLICMARSLLAKSQILLLDEATSSVDFKTDAIIQKTIREQFKGCTILTIAHRVQTIVDYDNVLVVSGGLVKEFDTPDNLLANPASEFSRIVAEMRQGNKNNESVQLQLT